MTSLPGISVCLCTYNPNREYLMRTLGALAQQSLAADRWELLVVDNASCEPLSHWLDLEAMFPHTSLLHEQRLGLTYARWKAIEHAQHEYILFVDDDNVLQTDYLEKAIEIMERHEHLGIIGGKIEGVFETTPPSWLRCYLPYLAIADFGNYPLWANNIVNYEQWYPRGAGMVMRSRLARRFIEKLRDDKFRQSLGRCGNSLTGSEDTDMVFFCMDRDYSVGYFPQLSLAHLIPAKRMQLGYIKRLLFQTHYSSQRLFLERKLRSKPRSRLISFIGNIALCVLNGFYHPVSWWLAWQVPCGKHAAWRDYTNLQKEHEHRELAAPESNSPVV